METVKATLICEGGAMRGVYTAGILDVFMQNGLYFDRVIGVSIGASASMCYVSNQQGRTINCMASKDKSVAFAGLPSLLKKGKLFDYDLSYEGFGDYHFPFDYDAFAKSPMKFEAVVTNLRTGEPEYIKCVAHHHQVMDACRASATLPFVSKPYVVNGIECYDGGVADPVPLARARSYGHEKIVVIMTKIPGYRRKKDEEVARNIIEDTFGDHPKFMEAMYNRYKVYNDEVDELDRLEKEGKIFVFRPAVSPCSRIESKYDKLMDGYNMGVQDAKLRFNDLMEYLNK